MLREYLRKICALWSPGGTLAAKMSGEEMEATGGNPELYFLLENIGFCIFSQDLGAEYSRRPRKEIFGRVSSSADIRTIFQAVRKKDGWATDERVSPPQRRVWVYRMSVKPHLPGGAGKFVRPLPTPHGFAYTGKVTGGGKN